MLYIIVPYRDRKANLDIFIKELPLYLDKYDIKYTIIIVEQDDNKLFNRGLIKNIGFKFVLDNMSLKKAYFCFHDIDVLPIIDSDKVNYTNPNNKIRHQYGLNFCLGCFFLCSTYNFIKINGFPNNYWGYGMEDCTLQMRAQRMNIEIDRSFFEQRDTSTNIKELYHTIFDTNVKEDENNKKLWLLEKNNINLMFTNGLNNVKYKITTFKYIKKYVFLIKVDITDNIQ